ncbi:hypothetical protein BJ742DRAFT_733917 [Cladochytrium replicatum]|nr:hypothetical protein BJ742DRAFT_733917 [Cladochytrium replicatum]
MACTLTEMVIAVYTTIDEEEGLDDIAYIVFGTIGDIIMFIFILEFFAKLYVFGIKYYFSSFLNFIDGFVTITSASLQIYLKGNAENAAALLIGFRIWRIFDFMQGVVENVQERYEPQVEELEEKIEEIETEIENLSNQLGKTIANNPSLFYSADFSSLDRPGSTADGPPSDPETGSNGREPIFVLRNHAHTVANRAVTLFFERGGSAASEPTKFTILRRKLGMFLDSPRVEWSILILVCVDILIVITELLISLFTTPEEEAEYFGDLLLVLSRVSLAILAVFVTELVSKFVAFGIRRFTDDWLESFDAIVVIVTFVAQVILTGAGGASANVIIFLRIWRVIRILSAISNRVEESYQDTIIALRRKKAVLEGELDCLRHLLEKVNTGNITPQLLDEIVAELEAHVTVNGLDDLIVI